ncbi:stage V sporulation protein AA [Radiobacillus sp. PE A8.2]|uniref:stage V sporulation protein AA n=1 Tax=Radiobacillus sp. PE A8.2 TaxID=3380349 RepID=UPI003890F391
MGGIIYIRLRKYTKVTKNEVVYLEDIAFLTGDSSLLKKMKQTKIYKVSEQDRSMLVIDVFQVISQLIEQFPEVEFQPLGPEQTILKIEKPKKVSSIFFVSIIWLLMFIGTAMAIMNFHYDVSMQEVQQKLHYLLTGEEEAYPLWIQVPYSLGLGIGMTLFFNHLLKKRLNEEPSPLEVEMFNYQQDLDRYITYYENDVDHNRHDHSSK